MSITAGKVPKVRSVTIIRSDPLPGAGAAVQQAARAARFVAAIGLLVVRRETPDLLFTDVSTSQTHSYEFSATTNPIQDGATVTDHVRRMPEALDVDGLIVDTPLGILPPTPIFASRASNNFQKLLAFAQERQPVVVATSLRIYENMLITRVVAARGVDSGSSIPVSISFREIRIAQALVELPAVAEAAAAVGAIPPTQAGQQSPIASL